MRRLVKWLMLNEHAIYAGVSLVATPVAWFFDARFVAGLLIGMAICHFMIWIDNNIRNAQRELTKMGIYYADGKRYRLTPEPLDNLQPTTKEV